MFVTFYSYKGGVGRTFNLANIAVVLGRWGYRVLCIDWDLEAPGLHHYFGPWYSQDAGRGLVEWIHDFGAGVPASWHDSVVPLDRLDLPGRVDFIPAGRFDDKYSNRAQDLDWATLYATRDLGRHLEDFRAEALAEYDIVLVDSRTGITDVGGICTAQLPDILVLCLSANNQSLGGVLDVSRRAAVARNGLPYDRGGLLSLPVLSRFDGREEYDRAAAWREIISNDLQSVYDQWTPSGITAMDLVERTTVPYFPIWSFGEELPAVLERGSNPDLVTYPLETIAALLVHRLDNVGALLAAREQYLQAAQTASAGTIDATVRPDPRVAPRELTTAPAHTRRPAIRQAKRMVPLLALLAMVLIDAMTLWTALVTTIQQDTNLLLVYSVAWTAGSVALAYAAGAAIRQRRRLGLVGTAWASVLLSLWLGSGFSIAWFNFQSETILGMAGQGELAGSINAAEARPVYLVVLMLILYACTGALAISYGYLSGPPMTARRPPQSRTGAEP